MAGLTARQSEILAYIQESLSEEGYPPSQRDIAARFGFSQTAARDHLQALVRKGEIEIAVNDARGIRLLRQFAPKPVGLPLLGRIAAGAPLAAPEHAESWLNIEPTLFQPRADFLHRVSGDSMIDAGIQDGDLCCFFESIAAHHSHVSPGNGQDAAASKWCCGHSMDSLFSACFNL